MGDLKDIYVHGIPTVFEDEYEESDKDIITLELETAINCIFGEGYGAVHEIIIIREYGRGDDIIINGCFNSKNKELKLRINSITNTKKVKNTISHELYHAKFTHDLFKKNTELFIISIRNDYTMYMINEYMACKYSNDYSYVVSELKDWISDAQNKFNDYYKDRLLIDNNKRKNLCTLISNIIVSNDKLKELRKSSYRIKNEDIKDIASILRKIDFIPTKEQYDELKELLNTKGFVG